MDSEFVPKTITILIIYLDYRFNRFFAAKNTLYMPKTIIELAIACNKSKMT